MPRSLGFLVLLLLAAVARGEEKPLWVAVGPKQLLEPLAPLAEARRAQGLETRLVEGRAPADLPAAASYLLIVGDDEVDAPADAPWRVAASRPALYRWRAVQPEHFASDALFADRDGDGAPDFPVGRLPAREPAEVAAVVAKILAFEKRAPSVDDLRLVAWAGAPGYGGAIDTLATGLLLTTVRQHAPPWVVPWFISGDASQPLCGWPPDQPALFGKSMRRGALLGAALAHGSADGIFSMRHHGRTIWFGPFQLECFAGDGPAPPLFLLSCNGAEFDRAEPSIAEHALLLPSGPVAVVGATTESHPLTNYFTGVALLKTVAAAKATRLGDLWFAAARQGQVEQQPLIEQMLKNVEGSLEPQIDVAKLRRDQLLLYAFLGDPALRVRLPVSLDAAVEKGDDGWQWNATRPEGATRLVVGFRPAAVALAAVPADADEPTKRRVHFVHANASEEFAVVGEITDGAWEGKMDRPGRLRLVALGPDFIAARVFDLK